MTIIENGVVKKFTGKYIRQDTPPPSLRERIWNYQREVRRWIAAGRPVRSAAEMQAIWNVCQACPHLLAKKKRQTGKCRLCGCRLNRKPHGAGK